MAPLFQCDRCKATVTQTVSVHTWEGEYLQLCVPCGNASTRFFKHPENWKEH